MTNSYRVVFPRGYRPSVVHACKPCATLALAKVTGTHSSPASNINRAYACDLRYDGCEHADGIKRY